MLQLTRHWSGLTQDTRAKFESIIAAQFCRYAEPISSLTLSVFIRD